MKYRTKLTLALMLVALMSNLIATSILYTKAKNIAFSEMQSKILSIVATASTFIDPAQLVEFQKNPAEDTLAYKTLRSQLLKTLNANKRKDLFVSFVYLFEKDPNNPNEIVVEVDTKSAEERLQAGHALVRRQEFLENDSLKQIGQYEVTKTFYKNPFGTWLSAFAPLKDAKGNTIGFIGMNVRASYVIKYLNDLLIFSAIALIFALLVAYGLAVILSKKFAHPLSSLCHIVEKIGIGELSTRCTYHENDEFGELANTLDDMVQGLEERQRLKHNFSRYVSKDILEIILKSEEKAHLEGERKKVTILFSDLRQFSLIAEKLSPEEVVYLLNEYFDRMIAIIFKYQGTLDKILGDGMMVLFGVPLEDTNQEENAINAAIEMQKELKRLCHKWMQEGKDKVLMGIGIHTGQAVIGNVGSEKHHLEYTAIGNTVNFAYKVEQATKQYKSPILITKDTLFPTKDKFNAISQGPLFIKEKNTGLEIFSVVGKK